MSDHYCCKGCGQRYDKCDCQNTRAAPKSSEPVAGECGHRLLDPDCPACQAAPPARDAAIPADRLSQFWRDIFPNGMSVDDVLKELADLETIGGEVSKVYCHVTGGRLSKPNTSASAVIGEADAVREREIEEALQEQPARDAEDASMRADAERYRWLRDTGAVFTVRAAGQDGSECSLTNINRPAIGLDAAIDAARQERKP
jgi:hypothetical protein